MSPGGRPPPAAPAITLSLAPADGDFAALFSLLEQETAQEIGPCRIVPFALLLHDSGENVVGGLWGRLVYQWLVVEMLVVPASERGKGTGRALMARAERVARERGCIGLHLTRLDFQAPSFYERLGFTIFGRQEDVPQGHTCFYLQKRLDGQSGVAATPCRVAARHGQHPGA